MEPFMAHAYACDAVSTDGGGAAAAERAASRARRAPLDAVTDVGALFGCAIPVAPTMPPTVEAEDEEEAALWPASDTDHDDTDDPSSNAAGRAALSSVTVGAWLQNWSSADIAVVMATEHRFLRQQIVALAKRINTENERAHAARSQKRSEAERERLRSETTDLLPAPSADQAGLAATYARLLGAPQAEETLSLLAPTEDAAMVPAGANGPTSLMAHSSSSSVAAAAIASRAPARAAKTTGVGKTAKVNVHMQAQTIDPNVQRNKHQLLDASRTVRQLRHLTANRCYVCKATLQPASAPAETEATPEDPRVRRHLTFTNHCHACGELNEAKRDTLIDLRGRIAVVTGGRIKIGYQICIRLLRCGATLLATSRFPANALCRYQQEPDYNLWKGNLHLLYADLCNPAEVQALAERIRALVPHVDILINNAAQTVRRPRPYYEQLNRIESASQQRLLQIAQDTHTPFTIEPHPQSQDHLHSHSSLIKASANVHTPQPQLDLPPSASSITATGESNSHVVAPIAASAVTPAPVVVVTSAPDSPIIAPSAVRPIAIAILSSDTTPQPAVSAAAVDPFSALSTAASNASSALSAAPPRDPTSSPPNLPALQYLRVHDGSGAVELPQRRFTPFSHIASLDDYSPAESAALFPPGRVDTTNDHEPLDLRSTNSWNATSDQVDPRELAEVLSINAMAPLVLCTQLRKHMERSPNPRRYIILVSSMEGKLNRCKADQHVHTNMAKAALNAIVRTTAAEYALGGIYLNSVDTGWNSEERPVNDPKRDPSFETPLDCADGAARVLDPIFVGETQHRLIVGQFLKDYEPTEW